MKVLHVISGGETGGSRKHVTTLLEQFPNESVCLLVFQDGPLAQEARQKGIRVEMLPQTSRYDLRIISKLASFINKEQFDIVHSHGPRANLFMSFIKKKIQAVWVTTIHSDPTLDFMKGGVKGRIFTMLNLRTLKKIDYFFAVSERFKDNLVTLGIPANIIHTIYNGITFSEPLERDYSLQKELKLSNDDFVMTMVARLHPIKGHDIVLEALKKLNNPEIHLVLVGDGPIRDEIEGLVRSKNLQDNVHFLGFRQDVDHIYSNSHIALLASHSESFPLALLEAANQKIPLISTDVGGVRQLISSNEYGWVVPTNDAEAFAEAITESYDNYKSGRLATKGEELYNHASTNFSLHALANSIDEVYKRLAKK
ncbi:glycosyltransferase family 4 protein [Bacillus massiliigorillae]|uniref:glycosyltransferase family 4 protein n=1 Tax=Bacillus massiliigorillae TaxID=1243664 RepID=UPI00039B0EC4|nr:glycosyltransferase family 4 protein [Bacillus massiliigorillae]